MGLDIDAEYDMRFGIKALFVAAHVDSLDGGCGHGQRQSCQIEQSMAYSTNNTATIHLGDHYQILCGSSLLPLRCLYSRVSAGADDAIGRPFSGSSSADSWMFTGPMT